MRWPNGLRRGDTGVVGDDRATNLEAYASPSLSVDRELVASVAAFVKAKN
ncbi:hypothetical protein LZ016_11745 [Sphingomonas sp. SM33]|uniref:Uncharacterized protein n=1 Tax=Sphingomonas telluris TaxID=2907998 RepID=A0ABS9VP75_9SPHN|nr:hypothetical protein [Sphingomonas telluris]MCH8616765.1 hypothetical protein [Sphingomonas telluris]